MKKTLALASSLLIASQVSFAGGRSGETNLMDEYLQTNTASSVLSLTEAAPLTEAACAAGEVDPLSQALVFSRQGLSEGDTANFESSFSFEKTLQTIIDTSNGGESTAPQALLDTMLETFSLTSADNNGVSMPLQVRDREANLTGLLEGGLQPTALFNRFDLANSDGSHCGEYRIVFHHTNGSSFFLIFEAQYPNPLPHQGVAGCYPVADFWHSLAGMNEADAIEALEDFFYEGAAFDDGVLPPAINFANFTHGSGQVRSNSIVNSPWQLREFKTELNNGSVEFALDTVKSNPLFELFNGNAPAGLTADFIQDLTNEYLDQILAPELAGVPLTDPIGIVNGIRLNNDDKYNEFQSDSSSTDDISSTFNTLDQAVLQVLEDRVTTLPSGYTTDMLRSRLEAMSCGGCHLNASRDDIAPGVEWPSPNGAFFHVSNSGSLSPALRDSFLPARANLLNDFVCNPPAIENTGPFYISHKVQEYRLAPQSPTELTSDITTVAPNNESTAARWMVEHSEDGFFRFLTSEGGLAIAPITQTFANGDTLVTIGNSGGTGNFWQQWKYIPTGDGFGRLRNRLTGQFLFLERGEFGAVGPQVQPSGWTGNWTRWKLEPVE